MTPYWQSPDGTITVYCAPWETVHAAGLVGKPDLVHADPPYGTGRDANRDFVEEGVKSGSSKARRRVFPQIEDSAPFEPAALLALDRPTVMWGANHYSVPASPSWIVWDKREGQTPDDQADAEVAWSNIGGPLRVFRHFWRGALRKTEQEARHLHPTQKPIALSTYVFQRAKLRPGALVFVPYLGSGPDLPAALAMGLRVVACDVEKWCCDTAIGRLRAVTAERAAEPVGPLFAPR